MLRLFKTFIISNLSLLFYNICLIIIQLLNNFKLYNIFIIIYYIFKRFTSVVDWKISKIWKLLIRVSRPRLNVRQIGLFLSCHVGLDKRMSRKSLSGSGWEISCKTIGLSLSCLAAYIWICLVLNLTTYHLGEVGD